MKLNIQKPVVMLVKLVVLFWVQGKALQQHFHGQNINKEKKKNPILNWREKAFIKGEN